MVQIADEIKLLVEALGCINAEAAKAEVEIRKVEVHVGFCLPVVWHYGVARKCRHSLLQLKSSLLARQEAADSRQVNVTQLFAFMSSVTNAQRVHRNA